MPNRIPDEDLRAIADDVYRAEADEVRAMAAELLARREAHASLLTRAEVAEGAWNTAQRRLSEARATLRQKIFALECAEEFLRELGYCPSCLERRCSCCSVCGGMERDADGFCRTCADGG